GIIPGTESLSYNEERRHVDHYVTEIIEAQKKKAIKLAAEGAARSSSDLVISSLREELDRIAKQTGRTEIISAENLQKKEFHNTEFIVDKIIPVGMTLLIGAPKSGKSWLLLLWANCIAIGSGFLGQRAKRAPVLYYTLEDSVRRCKYRLNKLLPPQTSWSRNLYFSETANGTIGLVNDIKSVNAQVVIIDTFGAFATVKDGNDYYETTRIIREIKEIADTMQVAVIVVHHTRKSSKDNSDDWTADIMGSQGLVGAADAIIALQRKRGAEKATLAITGRDISDSYIKLQFNDGFWGIDSDK
ncbi:MAG: helicase RepA family protein, partial [Treponema sp.]|nr:helicase RepA family protein [Treponema sp.]